MPQFFVKLPRYIADYLVCKYRCDGIRGHVVLPFRAHHAGRIIYRKLVSNPSFELMTPMCYNAQMYSSLPEDTPEEWRSRLPKVRGEFLGFDIPEEHWYDGRFVYCDNTMQLNRYWTAEFIRLIEDEFWADVDGFHKEYDRQWRIDHPDMRPREYDMLLDFMEMYHIDLDCDEAFVKQYKRRKHNLSLQ